MWVKATLLSSCAKEGTYLFTPLIINYMGLQKYFDLGF